ncbi:MAG: hypothetical protein HEP80_02420 [Dolichospermum sp. UKL201]|nr:MAG: hypothetical protein HEP80_02420 [Dolichospermum sp. UKL201]
MSVGAKHLEDKLSVIAKNSSPNASPVQLLEDKLSVIAKNSSPNASPVQLSVVSCPFSVLRCQLQKNISLLCSLFPVRCSLFPVPCSLFPLPLC